MPPALRNEMAKLLADTFHRSEVDAGGVPCRHRHRPGYWLGLRPIAGTQKTDRPVPGLAWRAFSAVRLPSIACTSAGESSCLHRFLRRGRQGDLTCVQRPPRLHFLASWPKLANVLASDMFEAASLGTFSPRAFDFGPNSSFTDPALVGPA